MLEKHVENTLKMMYNIVNMPIQLKTKVMVEEKKQTYGHVFMMNSTVEPEMTLSNRICKYDGDQFKYWESYKQKDFPNSEDPF